MGGGRIMGAETSVHNELAEVGGFAESNRRRFNITMLMISASLSLIPT